MPIALLTVASDVTVAPLAPQTCEDVACVPIECEVRGLQSGRTDRVVITGFLDERSFAVCSALRA